MTQFVSRSILVWQNTGKHTEEGVIAFFEETVSLHVSLTNLAVNQFEESCARICAAKEGVAAKWPILTILKQKAN